MTDYTKTTNFTAKDSLTTGDPNKVVSGAEIDAEFDALATASASKVDDGANSTLTSLTGLTTPLTVAQGGSGAATLTDGGVLLGSGTGAVTAMAVLADGEMIVGDGTTDPVAESGLTLLQSIGVDNLVDKNPIINGDFNSWQEGNPAAALGNGEDGTYFADLWAFRENGSPADEWTITKDTSVPTVAQSGHLSTSSLKAVCATDSTGNDSADATSLRYVIEGYDWQPYAQQIFTLSFWHKHTVTGTHSVVFANSGMNLEYGAEYNQAVTNTWEKAEIAVAASGSGGTWDYTNGAGLHLNFCLSAGSTRTFAAASTWADHSGDTTFQHGTDDCVDNASAAGNVFQIAQIKIDKGAVALPFIGRSFNEERIRTNRYLYYIDRTSTGQRISQGECISTTVLDTTLFYPEGGMRTDPTLDVSAATDFRASGGTMGTIDGSGIAIALTGGGSHACRLRLTCSGLTDGESACIQFDATSNTFLALDARL